jgi:DNA-binding beta-propeller fold protein YncE
MKNLFRISGVVILVLSIILIHSCKKDKPTPPVITTTAITAISQTTATSGGNITSDGGATVTARGVCWSTTTRPTTALSTKTTDGTGIGIFTSSITGLTAGTVCYVRAYVTNSAGTAYGNEISFTTTASTVPVLTTTAASAITQTTATSGGNITSDGGASVTARGVCWSTRSNPVVTGSHSTDGTGTGSFVSNLTGLTVNITYYVRAYARNSAGTAYGNELSFNTSAVTMQVQWALETVISTGAYSSGIAITPDNSKIIVTNNTTPGTIKVISTSNYAISSISYPANGYPNGVAVTPDGLTAVVNTSNQTIFIDLSTNSVRGNFPAPCVATSLYGIAVTPNGNNAIYPDLSSGCTQQGLRSINTTTPSGSSFIPVSTSGVLYGIDITPDGSSAIVTTFSLGSPKKVNLLTSVVQNISGMNGSYGVAILHNGNEALIESDSLKRVSLTSNMVTKNISDIYSTTFQSIAITADDKYAFVVGDFKKIVVSLTDNTVIQTFSTGGTNVATTSDGSRFFVTNSYNGTVSVYKKVIPGK